MITHRGMKNASFFQGSQANAYELWQDPVMGPGVNHLDETADFQTTLHMKIMNEYDCP
jgi:hypothetical protein